MAETIFSAQERFITGMRRFIDVKNTYLENPEVSFKISNGVSIARIISMFWIFSVNYFPFIFKAFYGVEYQYAIETSRNYINVMETSPWIIDKIIFVASYAGWSGVVIFAIMSGFSLWLSILTSGTFRVGDYVVKRFNSIYVSYFIAVIIAFIAGSFIRNIELESFSLVAMTMGAARFVGSAYEYNPPMWFITLMLLCYLFFPIIPIIYNRFRILGVTAAVACFCGVYLFFRLSFGPSYYLTVKGPEYPLMPFWVFLCFGLLASHFIFKHRGMQIRIRNISLRVTDALCAFAIPVSGYLFYWFIYLEPQKNLATSWNIFDPYWLGVVAAVALFAIGYYLPASWHKPLRWLSRGTLAVFLYHYIILPFLIPYMKPPLFTQHLSVALLGTYVVMLAFLSMFQYILDKTIVKFTRHLTSREYKLTN